MKLSRCVFSSSSLSVCSESTGRPKRREEIRKAKKKKCTRGKSQGRATGISSSFVSTLSAWSSLLTVDDERLECWWWRCLWRRCLRFFSVSRLVSISKLLIGGVESTITTRWLTVKHWFNSEVSSSASVLFVNRFLKCSISSRIAVCSCSNVHF